MTLKSFILSRKFVAAGAFCALSACQMAAVENASGSTTRSDQDIVGLRSIQVDPALLDEVVGNTLSRSEMLAWDNAVTPIAESIADDLPVTSWANVPDSGTATYYGGIQITSGTDRIFGRIEATTDFGPAGSIVGEASNFVETGNPDLPRISGSLDLDANFLRGSDLDQTYGISGNLSGTLSANANIPSNSQIVGDVDIEVAGDFADDAGVIYGAGEGTAGSTNVATSFIMFEAE